MNEEELEDFREDPALKSATIPQLAVLIKATKDQIDVDLKKLQRNQNVANKGNLSLLEYIKDWIDSPRKHYYIKNGNHVKYSSGALSSKTRAHEILADFGKKNKLDFDTISKDLWARFVCVPDSVCSRDSIASSYKTTSGNRNSRIESGRRLATKYPASDEPCS